jgi:hypothetical protein
MVARARQPFGEMTPVGRDDRTGEGVRAGAAMVAPAAMSAALASLMRAKPAGVPGSTRTSAAVLARHNAATNAPVVLASAST